MAEVLPKNMTYINCGKLKVCVLCLASKVRPGVNLAALMSVYLQARSKLLVR